MIALHPPRLDASAVTVALTAELALLRDMHMLLNEEERLLAPRTTGIAGATTKAGPEAVNQAIAELTARRAHLAARLQAASRVRAELFLSVGGSPIVAKNAPSFTPAINRPDESALANAWRSVRAAYAHVARRQEAHAHIIQSHCLYLQSRWNGLMQSAGNARGYNRSGGAATGQQVRRLLVSV